MSVALTCIINSQAGRMGACRPSCNNMKASSAGLCMAMPDLLPGLAIASPDLQTRCRTAVVNSARLSAPEPICRRVYLSLDVTIMA